MERRSSLDWRLESDVNVTLRVTPVVDGVPLTAYFDDAGGVPIPAGVALGIEDAGRLAAVGADRDSLPLLSCACGAYDCRVRADVVVRDGAVCWTNMKDARTSTVIPDCCFDQAVYRQAFEALEKEVKRRSLGYRVRIWQVFRDDSLLGGASWMETILLLAWLGFFIWGAAGSSTGDVLWVATLVAVVVVRGVNWWRGKRRGGDVWLDGAASMGRCPWHEQKPVLMINWRKSPAQRKYVGWLP